MKKRWGKLRVGAIASVLMGIIGVQQGVAAPIDTYVKVERGHSQFLVQFNEKVPPQIALTMVHLVKKGDSVWSIAIKYGVSANQLLNLNRLNSQQPLQINQRVIVPVKSSASVQQGGQKQVQLYLFVDEKETPLTKKTNVTRDMKSHLVQSGDTIFSIARKYKISEDQLRQVNGLSAKSYLLIGQTLKIPQISYHSVKPGETLTQISRVYKTSVQQLLEANSLNLHEHIVPGQQLKIVK